jgi:hypothetical protein
MGLLMRSMKPRLLAWRSRDDTQGAFTRLVSAIFDRRSPRFGLQPQRSWEPQPTEAGRTCYSKGQVAGPSIRSAQLSGSPRRLAPPKKTFINRIALWTFVLPSPARLAHPRTGHGGDTTQSRGRPILGQFPLDRIGARQNLRTQTMKHLDQITRWGGLAVVVGLVCAMSPAERQAGNTKPFKETGMEYFWVGVIPGSFQHPFFNSVRALRGTEDLSGSILHVSQNNVGGAGSGTALEIVYFDGTAPNGVVVYAMKFEVVANGDQLVMAGMFVPQADGSIVGEIEFLPTECTGRFAGATGTLPVIRAIPGPGYVFEGRITTVGATK